MYTLSDSERKLDNAHRTRRDISGVQDHEVSESRRVVATGDDQKSVRFRSIRGAGDKARLPDRHVRACVPHFCGSGGDVNVQDGTETPRCGAAGPEGVVVGLRGVAVVAAGHLAGHIADDFRWLHLRGLGGWVYLEPDELAHGRTVAGIVRRLKFGMLGGENAECIRVVEEGVDVNAAVVALEMVTDVAPVVVL